MASQTYSLGTILAIAIPLGSVTLAAILALVALTLRISCLSLRQNRERQAWESVNTGDYRRKSASTTGSMISNPNRKSRGDAFGITGVGDGSRNHATLNSAPKVPGPPDSFRAPQIPPLAALTRLTSVSQLGYETPKSHSSRKSPGINQWSNPPDSQRTPAPPEDMFSHKYSDISELNVNRSKSEPKVTGVKHDPNYHHGEETGSVDEQAGPDVSEHKNLRLYPFSDSNHRAPSTFAYPDASHEKSTDPNSDILTTKPLDYPALDPHTGLKKTSSNNDIHTDEWTKTNQTTNDRDKVMRLLHEAGVPEERILEGKVSESKLSQFRRGHYSVASLSGSVLTTGGTPASSATKRQQVESQTSKAIPPPLNEVSEGSNTSLRRTPIDKTSFVNPQAMSDPASPSNSSPWRPVRVSRSSSRTSSLASSYGTAHPAPQPPIGPNGDGLHSHAAQMQSVPGISGAPYNQASAQSSIRNIANLHIPKLSRSPVFQPDTSPYLSFMKQQSLDKMRQVPADSYSNQISRWMNKYSTPGSAFSSIPYSPTKDTSQNTGDRSLTGNNAKLNKPLPTPPAPAQSLKSENGVIADLAGTIHRVVVSYKPQLSDELELQTNELIRVYQLFDDGWCLARSNDAQGICPEACLVRV